jgi:lysine 2,3-aminomutase
MNDPRPIRNASAFDGARTLRRPAELVAADLVGAERLPALEAVAARYAVAITPDMAELIDPADGNDPIARQFVPDAAELTGAPEETADPIGDDVHEAVPGLVHRYPDRVLLKFTSVCPVYCRFCFRRETVGQGDTGILSARALARALDYVRADANIWEVVVSGGDPLIAAPRRISGLTAALAAIEHIKTIRFHTRVPVVAPERVTGDLVEALQVPGATTWVAVHANHARELTVDARAALGRLVDAGIPLVGQTVLLRGVNDNPDTLGALMRAFVEARVKPYYLHHGDLAPGTGHFRTTIAAGRKLMQSMRGRYSGLCQPTYVLDIPGGFGKVPIGPCHLSGTAGDYEIVDVRGDRHAYRDG